MNLIRRLVILTIIPSILLLTACGGDTAPTATVISLEEAVKQTVAAMPTETSTPTPTTTPTPTATPTQVIVRYGPDNFPANVNPLTGLEVSDPSILDRRPVMVKVANFPYEGRPHVGLPNADIVFDYYTGEGQNRFLALYYGQDASVIGPMRSMRLVDRYLVGMYQGVLAGVHGFETVVEKVYSYLGALRIVNEGPNACPAICRDKDIVMPLNAFGNSAEISKTYAARTNSTNTRQNLDGMLFHTIPPAGGVAGTEVIHHFGKTNEAKWVYNEETGKYMRWIDNNGVLEFIPLVDRSTGEQLQFSNVIILFAQIETLNKDDSVHEFKIINTTGRAVVFRDGQMFDVTYKSANMNPFQFIDKDGQPFALQPGNTWIHMTGSYTSITETSPGVFFSKIGLP